MSRTCCRSAVSVVRNNSQGVGGVNLAGLLVSGRILWLLPTVTLRNGGWKRANTRLYVWMKCIDQSGRQPGSQASSSYCLGLNGTGTGWKRGLGLAGLPFA